jgi:hypothetical protein
MASPETVLTIRQELDFIYIQQGVVDAVDVAEIFGCRGKALDEFSAGVDKAALEAKRAYLEEPSVEGLPNKIKGMAGSVGKVILGAAEKSGVDVDVEDARALGFGFAAASIAFRELPSSLSLEHKAESDVMTEGAGIVGMIGEFYKPLVESHPEVIEGDIVGGEILDPGDALELNGRVSLWLAERTLLIELKRLYPESTAVVNDIVEKVSIAASVDPIEVLPEIPAGVIADTIKVNALEFNSLFVED